MIKLTQIFTICDHHEYGPLSKISG